MVASLPSIPYPPAGDGFWSPVTSTINWCEEDYYASHYFAEIVNTLTNLVFVYLAYEGIANCLRNGHDRVYLVAFLSYLSIGLGSFAFHASLKYPMQLLDELSMVYTTCVLFYAIFSHARPPLVKLAVFIFITATAAGVTGYYHYLQDPLFHQNAFALLTVIVVFRSIWAMETILKPQKGKKVDGEIREWTQKEKRDYKTLKEMRFLVRCGLGSVALGFLIWNLDNAYCSNLRRWRRSVGLPWGILLEGHGWWHIMTGIAAYINLTWAVWLRYCLDGKQDEVELVWPRLFSVPLLKKKDRKAHAKAA
ncbi:alkaline phytoceramidase [Aulographum hederae CBS 113979]|uniref:Alkaline phytoceramidase n=1 Tax=Aulographum hederae CBS 113979 TaxID=1176131 RepID=A0A6G1HHC4_9PEZI|nr:alkaline phytoceramidase [Aulographum hederae CBS 113979]